MPTDNSVNILDEEALSLFKQLQSQALLVVRERFYQEYGFNCQEREIGNEELLFLFEFLTAALQFGLFQSLTDYLNWLCSVQKARDISTKYLRSICHWLTEFYQENMETTEARKVVDVIQQASKTLKKKQQNPVLIYHAWPEVNAFEAALICGNYQKAHEIVDQYIQLGYPLTDIELHLIQPALYEIGEKWQANLVTIAQEHMATSIVQSIMSLVLQNFPAASSVNRRILLACVSGNNHSVGLQMVSHSFLLAGWDVQYLGSDVPTDTLVQQTIDWRPELIGLSLCFVHQINKAKNIIEQLHTKLAHHRPVVIVGGLAFNSYNSLADVVGADLFGTDAKAAFELANEYSY